MLTRDEANELVDQEMEAGFEHLRGDAIDEAMKATSYNQARSWVRQMFDECACESADAGDFEERAYGRD